MEGIGCPARQSVYHDPSTYTFRISPTRTHRGHNHDLDLCDQDFKNNFIRHTCLSEICNGYSAAQILSTLRGHDGRYPEMKAAMEEAGGQYLTVQDITNYGRKYLEEHRDSRFIGSQFSVDQQMEEVRHYLVHEQEGWNCELYEVARTDSHRARGIVWIKKSCIDALKRFGKIFLLDATHDTNWLQWQLYTILVRDSSCSWIPAGHTLTATQDSEVLQRALVQLKVWCGGSSLLSSLGFWSEWDPQYAVTDDSAVEKKAIREAFPGLSAGGTRPLHLLCTVHYERNIRKQFPGAANEVTRGHLLTALRNNLTEESCRKSLDQAVANASERRKSYIRRNMMSNTREWAHWARAFSALLQVGNTNPLEGYHSALKHGKKTNMRRFSLLGAVKMVNATDGHFFDRAKRKRQHFRGHISAMASFVPGIASLPAPVQKLMEPEIRKGKAMYDGDELPRSDSYVGPDSTSIGRSVAHCGCHFFRKWNLPCKDIIYFHFKNGSIPEDIWRRLSDLWKESGFELYFATASPARKADEERASDQRQEARALEEMLRASSFTVEDQAFSLLAPDDARRFLSWRTTSLQEVIRTALSDKITLPQWLELERQRSQNPAAIVPQKRPFPFREEF